MLQAHTGEMAALATAVCWTVTALSYEAAAKKVGSLPVSFWRLIFAFIMLSVFNWIYRGSVLPLDAGNSTWMWLSISGIIGLVIGDIFLFESYTIIGSRTAMLIMTLVPVITSIISWLMLDETLTLLEVAGMLLTISGIALVIIFKKTANVIQTSKPKLRGYIFAGIGAVGQAVGLVFSKKGMKNYDAFASTQIRIIVGIIGFIIVLTVFKRWTKVRNALKSPAGMGRIGLGSIFGPFLGISLSLVAIQHTNSGVAATIISIVPVLIVPASIIFLRQRASVYDVLGALISVLGVSLLFL